MTLEPPEQNAPRTVRNMWRIFAAVVALILLYTAYTFWSRWQENQDLAAKQKAAQAAAQREDAEKTYETLGGSDFKIVSFYAHSRHNPSRRHSRNVLRRLQRQIREARSPRSQRLALQRPLPASFAQENHNLHLHRRRRQRQHQNRHPNNRSKVISAQAFCELSQFAPIACSGGLQTRR